MLLMTKLLHMEICEFIRYTIGMSNLNKQRKVVLGLCILAPLYL